MDGLIPVASERSAYQTACQHCCREVNQIDSEKYIACDAKWSCIEDPNVQEDDGGTNEGHGGDPEKLADK